MFKRIFTKADIVLLVILVAAGLATSVFLALSGDAGSKVIIESDGKLYATYRLDQNISVEVKSKNGTNTVVIENGRVDVTQGSCRNQVCVEHATISRSGESIVCLPNRLLVKIEGEGGDGPDVISG